MKSLSSNITSCTTLWCTYWRQWNYQSRAIWCQSKWQQVTEAKWTNSVPWERRFHEGRIIIWLYNLFPGRSKNFGTYASLTKLHIHKADIKSAFFQNGQANREIYVKPRKESIMNSTHVRLLTTAAHELGNANAMWQAQSDHGLIAIQSDSAVALSTPNCRSCLSSCQGSWRYQSSWPPRRGFDFHSGI